MIWKIVNGGFLALKDYVAPQSFIQSWLGGKGILSSFLATLIGAVNYFATMTEAPFADTLFKLGIGKGPALALLLTGSGMSLPSILANNQSFWLEKGVRLYHHHCHSGHTVGWFSTNFIF